MTPRPFYRWKSFWFGLFFSGFLSWAWRESFQQPFHITRFQSPRYYQAFHADGEIVFRQGDGAKVKDWWIGRLPTNSLPMSRVKAAWDRDRLTYLAIPYTFIMASSVLGLSGLIVWRTRHWKRLATLTAGMPGEP